MSVIGESCFSVSYYLCVSMPEMSLIYRHNLTVKRSIFQVYWDRRSCHPVCAEVTMIPSCNGVDVCSLVQWLSSSAVYEMGSDAAGAAEYQTAAGGNVTVYVDSGRGHTGPTLGGAGYSRVCVYVCE